MPRMPRRKFVKKKLPESMGGMTALGIRDRKTGRTKLMKYIGPDRETTVSSFLETLFIYRPRK